MYRFLVTGMTVEPKRVTPGSFAGINADSKTERQKDPGWTKRIARNCWIRMV